MKHLTSALGTLSLAFVGLAAIQPASAQRYSVTDLGKENIGWAINNHGQVAGYRLDNGGFLWTPTTSFMTTGIVTTLSIHPWSINSSGCIVGGSGVWTPTFPNGSTGSLVDLNATLPATSGWVVGSTQCINDAGLIIGTGTYTDVLGAAVHETFGWQQDTAGNVVMTPISSPPFRPSASNSSINNLAYPQVVVGGFLWQNGVLTNISAQYNPSGGYPLLENRSINDVGQIAGQIWGPIAPLHAFVWTPDSPNTSASAVGVQDLHPVGYYLSYARCVNNFGQVVGAAQLTSTSNAVAAMWDNTGWHNLNGMCNPLPAGWNLLYAYGANSRIVNGLPAAQITGRASVTVTTTTTVHNKKVTTTTIENHGFLLTPQ